MRMDEFEIIEILSPQEHGLRGSTVDKEYQTHWYTPILVQKGWDPEFISDFRSRFGVFGAFSMYMNEKDEDSYGMDVIDIALQPLDSGSGETIADPDPIDEKYSIRDDIKRKLRFRNLGGADNEDTSC